MLEFPVCASAGADLTGIATTSAGPGELWIGLDTGGTFTDAVALSGERRIVASAKALTTHWDLSIGLAEAIRRCMRLSPDERTQVRILASSGYCYNGRDIEALYHRLPE